MRRFLPILGLILGLSTMHTPAAHAAVISSPAVIPTGSVSAGAAEIDLFAFLAGGRRYARADGDSEYDLEGARREVEVTVTHITRLAGKRVTVYVAGKRVGTMQVSSRGRAHREWSTARRQSVPLAGAGSQVSVRAANGALIVSGTYHRDID